MYMYTHIQTVYPGELSHIRAPWEARGGSRVFILAEIASSQDICL